MTLTTNQLASYLGKPARELISLPPFSGWQWQRTIEEDLDKTVIDYVFPEGGTDIVCDKLDNVTTIFAYNDAHRRFGEELADLPFTFTREQVVNRFGCPSKSGQPMKDSILGDFGAWDRFENEQFTIHVEYHLDSQSIKKITIMRADVVP